MGNLLAFLRNLGTVRLTIMGAVLFGLVFFFTFMISRLTGTNLELLFAIQDPTDQAAVTTQLSSRGVPFEVQGNKILVPADQVASLRLSLAADGIPGSGAVGYEIFDDASTLGTTNFMQNVQLVRALEGELSKTIKSIEAVQSARVHLVMPRRKLFSRDKQGATASVILKLRGASSLSNGQVAAIQYLVAAAVPELDPTKVSIVDSRGKLLAKGNEVDSAATRSSTLVERKVKFENRMAAQLTDLLERSVGIGNAKVTVQADLDFDRISTTEETFDPDGQVARSTKSIEESSNAEEAEGSEPVTVETNLPDGAGNNDATGNTSRNVESRAEEVTNFEISKKITNHVREIGLVRRLSVAVLIDGELVENESGEVVYRERSDKEMEDLGRLVVSAAGIVENRGDSLEIINMRFIEDEIEEDEPLSFLFGLDNNEIIRIAEVIVLLILAVLVILLVIRPLLARAFEALPAATAAAEQKLLEEAAAMSPALTGPESTQETDTEYEELIDIDRVEGRVKASSVKKVGEIVEKHPEEALSIIRTWMYQEA